MCQFVTNMLSGPIVALEHFVWLLENYPTNLDNLLFPLENNNAEKK